MTKFCYKRNVDPIPPSFCRVGFLCPVVLVKYPKQEK